MKKLFLGLFLTLLSFIGTTSTMDNGEFNLSFNELFEYAVKSSGRLEHSHTTTTIVGPVINKENDTIQCSKPVNIILNKKKSPLYSQKPLHNQKPLKKQMESTQTHVVKNKKSSYYECKPKLSFPHDRDNSMDIYTDSQSNALEEALQQEYEHDLMKIVLTKIKAKSERLETACATILSQNEGHQFYLFLKNNQFYGIIKLVYLWYSNPVKNMNVQKMVAEAAEKLEEHIFTFVANL